MAKVLGHGQAHQLFEVSHIVETPQVHIHFFTSSEEYRELGYGRLELCCHGCGSSLLVLYTEPSMSPAPSLLRDMFAQQHRGCPNRGYQRCCPNWRTSFRQADLRAPKQDRTRNKRDASEEVTPKKLAI